MSDWKAEPLEVESHGVESLVGIRKFIGEPNAKEAAETVYRKKD